MIPTKYTSRLTVAVPMANMPIAQPIAQAFDPDTGGKKSFDIIRAKDANGNLWAISDGACRPETAAGILIFQANPGHLKAYIDQDFAARFPEEVAPTLAECTTFCNAICVATGKELADALAEMELLLNNPEERA